MKILINAIRLNSAGGLRVGQNLLKEFDALKRDEDEIVFLCSSKSYSGLDTKNIKKEFIPEKYLKTIHWLSGQKWTKKQLMAHKPDIVFNFCNTPLKTKSPQLLLIHWPYAVFDQDYIWKKMSWLDYLKRKLRLYLIKRNYGYVDHLTVQTETMKKRGENNFLKSKEITVIPSSFDLEISEAIDQSIFEKINRSFLYLSRYYYHKNHDILIDVAKLIKKRGLDHVIQITVDKNNPDAKNFLKKIVKEGVENQIENLGSIPPDKINEVFEQAYATINPSFLESFGLTYLEAASKGKLVLASDLDFVRETMQDAAIYFDPFNAESLLNAMEQSMNKEYYLEKAEKGIEIVKNWPSWKEVTEIYYNLLGEISEKVRTN
jgi:glycosyltransferase involved in cell wall biosynthesis